MFRSLFLVLLLSCVFVGIVHGQYVFEVSSESDGDGHAVNFQAVTVHVSFEELDGERVLFTDVPSGTSTDDDDLQEWFIDSDASVGYHKVTFSFTGIGLVLPRGRGFLQYWFRYSKDGVLFSESVCVAVVQPARPIKG